MEQSQLEAIGFALVARMRCRLPPTCHIHGGQVQEPLRALDQVFDEAELRGIQRRRRSHMRCPEPLRLQKLRQDSQLSSSINCSAAWLATTSARPSRRRRGGSWRTPCSTASRRRAWHLDATSRRRRWERRRSCPTRQGSGTSRTRCPNAGSAVR